MISKAQKRRTYLEFKREADIAIREAGEAERDFEGYTYRSDGFNPVVRDKKLERFNEADYMAESRVYILQLIKKDMNLA